MYEAHFGLRQRPFRAIPDSERYYPATSHEHGLAQALQAIQDEEGLILITGDAGTGKTLLGHCLLDRLGEKVSSAFLTNSHFGSRAGLLQAMLYDLGLPYAGLTEEELRLALTDFLLKTFEAGKHTVLIVDEAQHLTPDLLEEVRLLGNLEGGQGRALTAVLLAQPSLCETLAAPVLAVFQQRLAVSVRLEPLGVHEAADYLVHQIRAAGGNPSKLFSDEALEILARETQGVPRLLNRAAHQALTLAFTAGAELVDAEVALEALGQLGVTSEATADAGEEEIASHSKSEEETPASPKLSLEEAEDSGELEAEGSLNQGRARRLFAGPRRPA
jgi:type II secretory pathway predicted ATPase ExeA